MHGEVVCLDYTVVVCHGQIVDPSEVRRVWIISRVAKGLIRVRLLFGHIEIGSGVGITTGEELKLSM